MMMMETVRMQPTVPHQQQPHHLHHQIFRPPGAGPGGGGPGQQGQFGNGDIDAFINMDMSAANNNTVYGRAPFPPGMGPGFGDPSGGLQHQLNPMLGSLQPDTVRFVSYPSDRQNLPQQQHFLLTNANQNGYPLGKNNNKRLSMDFNGNISEYSVESWPAPSPRSTTTVSSDGSPDSLQLQMYRGHPPKSIGLANFPNGSKRQNVGNQRLPMNGSAPSPLHPALLAVAAQNPAKGGHLLQQQQSTQQQQQPLPPGFQYLHPGNNNNNNNRPAVFMGNNIHFYPRMPDLMNLAPNGVQPLPMSPVSPRLNGTGFNMPGFLPQPRSQVAQVFGPRLPFPPAATHQPHQHQLQQQNFYFTGPMGPPSMGQQTQMAPTQQQQQMQQQNPKQDTSSNEKKARFLRTAQMLEQSGLMECTLKTAALIRENAGLQREIDAITAEANQLIAQYIASKTNQPNPNSLQQQQQPVVFENQSQQQQQQQQHVQSTPISIQPPQMFPNGGL